MSNLLKVSDAASLALHTAAFLSASEHHPISTQEIASSLHVSEAHLAKVLQRLAKHGVVRSFRGPKGGFILGKDADEITLLEVYEAIDGPLGSNYCLFDLPVCNGNGCILGGLSEAVHRQVRDYLAGTVLSSLTHVYRRVDGHA